MKLLNINQFAKEYGCTRQRVNQMIADKIISPDKVIYPDPPTIRIWGSEVARIKIKKQLKQK